MPKKIDEEEFEDEDDEDFDEDDEDEDEEPPKQRRVKPAKVKPAKKRFMAFQAAPRAGVIDSETEEVISEGDLAVLQNQAEILTRLERIENLVGNLVSG